ncbi:MAG: acyl-ACP--UDP-N-acetylglucosamine O-acyltransferase [Verrucomicrobia bacterium]|nr:acyl-ACP--UDP-N-acetylglucosamine O-acyltransferase [Verrucomicrobiota bacterium]
MKTSEPAGSDVARGAEGPCIHPTAIVGPEAELDSAVEVGPYAVIQGRVRLGPNCRVGPYVHLTGCVLAGAGNVFHTGAVIGDAPQDLKYKGQPTRVVIGDSNCFREHVTVHRSNREEEDTVIGDHNFLMAHSHVGHNARVGHHVILANGALLGGHTVIQDRAFISGNCLVHQFARVGTLAIMQGGAAISQDLPPFCIARGHNHIGGLNVIGLRRAGFSAAQRSQLRQLYQELFRSGRNLRAAVEDARHRYSGEPASILLDFVAQARRGICRHKGSRWDPQERLAGDAPAE